MAMNLHHPKDTRRCISTYHAALLDTEAETALLSGRARLRAGTDALIIPDAFSCREHARHSTGPHALTYPQCCLADVRQPNILHDSTQMLQSRAFALLLADGPGGSHYPTLLASTLPAQTFRACAPAAPAAISSPKRRTFHAGEIPSSSVKLLRIVAIGSNP